MSLLLSLALAGAGLLSIELRGTSSYAARAQARLNAKVAARLALGELQMRMGRDRTASIPFPGHDGWVGAADTPASPSHDIPVPVPLVSGFVFLEQPGEPPFGWAEIERESVPPSRVFPAVRVPWVEAGALNTNGRFAYWVQDESQKADAGTFETRKSQALPDIQARRQLSSPRHVFDSLWPVRRDDRQSWSENLSAAFTWRQLLLAWNYGSVRNEPPPPLHPRLHTRASRGVLADSASGGLRINWDQRPAGKISDADLPCERALWEDFLHPPPAFAGKPSAGLQVTGMKPASLLRRFPVLSGLRVRFGVFHSHHDAYNRTRFHCEVQLWNPYPFPLTCTEKDFIGLLDFEKMPTLTVSNLNTGATMAVDMSAFPMGKFGVQQTPSDGTVNANLLFSGTPPKGMAAQGLLAGEVYNFFMPSPAAQPEGLARTLSAVKWYIQSDPKKPATPPASATEGNWLHATHQIEIKGEMPTGGVTLHIRQAKGKFSTGIPSREYSDPVLTLKNLPFENFKILVTGAEFDRPDSTSYVVSEARFGLSLRLRTNNPDRIAKALESLDPREPVLDFNDPAVSALYEVITDVVNGRDVPLATTPAESFWWDAGVNSHEATGSGEAFADVRALDRPIAAAPFSTGALRHLPREQASAGALNPKYPAGREADAAWFDHAFFAGVWHAAEEATLASPVDGLKRPWSRNPWLEPLQKNPPDRGDPDGAPPGPGPLESSIPSLSDAAAHCLLRGTFNVNCREAEPWRLVLSRTLPAWRRCPAQNETAAPEAKDLRNVLFRLPFGADQPRQNGENDSAQPDEDLRTAGEVLRARSEGMQGFRALDFARCDKLAEELAAAVRRYQDKAGGVGFHSLREFAMSGVLAEAIERSGCNTKEAMGKVPAPVSPLHINPGDILESILPALSARGDTFNVRVRGAVLSLAGKELAHADAEVEIQRFPEFFDASQAPMSIMESLSVQNQIFGRRFKVVSWRWLDADER
jgi:hypothetical protein